MWRILIAAAVEKPDVWSILDQHASSVQATASLFASLAALIAVIVTLRSSNRQLRATIEIAEKQLKATVVSGNRQAWIDKLRDELATILATVFTMHASDVAGHELQERSRIVAQLNLSIAKISLLLNQDNHDEKDREELMNALHRIPKTIADYRASDTGDSVTIATLASTIMSLSTRILKREWERVKSLD